MIIGIVGKKQSGKDTVCNIIRYISWLKSSKLWGEVTLNAKHFEAVRESEVLLLYLVYGRNIHGQRS